MSKRTIISVEIPVGMVEDIKQVQTVMPISKSDIFRLALRYYLDHVVPMLPVSSSTQTVDPYKDDEPFPGCKSCPASGEWDKCPCPEYERFERRNS